LVFIVDQLPGFEKHAVAGGLSIWISDKLEAVEEDRDLSRLRRGLLDYLAKRHRRPLWAVVVLKTTVGVGLDHRDHVG